MAEDFQVPSYTTNVNTGSGQQINTAQSGHLNSIINNNHFYRSSTSLAEEALDWLSVDPWIHHASIRSQHQAGTGAWLLQRGEYEGWISGTARHLWLHGKMGCGKTLLCSTVIHDLSQRIAQDDAQKAGLAYFYFAFSDTQKQSYDDLLRALVLQLVRNTTAISIIERAYNRKDRPMLTTEELESALRICFEHFNKIFVVLDALDESPEDSRLSWSMRFGKMIGQFPQLKLFFTSRYNMDIVSFAKTLDADELALQSDDMSDDISQFRWTSLLLQKLRKSKKSSRSAVQKLLREFPENLSEVYARTLQEVDQEDRQNARTLLCWIAHARRPLSLEELQEVLVIDVDHYAVKSDDDREGLDYPLKVLSGLITTTNTTQRISHRESAKNTISPVSDTSKTVVQLAHFSVKEFLGSQVLQLQNEINLFYTEEQLAQSQLSKSCLTYLIYWSDSDEKALDVDDLTTFPLLRYAAEQWGKHLQRHQKSDWRLETAFFSSMFDHCSFLPTYRADRETRYCSDWLTVHNPGNESITPFFFKDYDPEAGLASAASFGLNEVVENLLRSTYFDDNASRSRLQNTALRGAVFSGHVDTARLLLKHGAEVNLPKLQITNLATAAHEGWLDMTRLLVENGAHVNAWSYQGTALMHASRRGSIEIVRLLLERDADPRTMVSGSTALGLACSNGHTDIVILLLQYGADIDAITDAKIGEVQITATTALCATCFYGQDHVVKLLIEHGAMVDEETICFASFNGSKTIIDLLLDHGFGIRSEPCSDATLDAALDIALSRGHLDAAESLLKHDATISNISIDRALRNENVRYENLMLILADTSDYFGASARARSKG